MASSDPGCNWDGVFGITNGTAAPDDTAQTNPSHYVYLIGYPILLCCCTMGSLLIVAALLKDSIKTSSTVYLICLAVSDLCVLWSILPDYIVEAQANLGMLNENSSIVHDSIYYKGFGSFWGETATQFSDWTLIIFAVERLVVSLRPLRRRTVPDGFRKAIIVQAVVLFLAILFSLSYLVWYYYYMSVADTCLAPTLPDVLQLCAPALYRWYLLQTDAEMGMWIAKWILLLIFDVSLMAVLWLHWNAMRRHYPGLPVTAAPMTTTTNANATVPRNASIILAGSLTLYTVSQLPLVILTCLKIARRPPYCSYNLTPDAENRATPVVNIISWSNYCMSFFVYCLVSSKFRRQFRSLYRRTSEQASYSASSKRMSAATEIIVLDTTRRDSNERFNRIMSKL